MIEIIDVVGNHFAEPTGIRESVVLWHEDAYW